MSGAIKVGDRCEVIKWPCCGKWVNAVMMVSVVGRAAMNLRCATCDHVHNILNDKVAIDQSVPQAIGLLVSCPTAWLRKLPPLTEPESTETTREETIDETV